MLTNLVVCLMIVVDVDVVVVSVSILEAESRRNKSSWRKKIATMKKAGPESRVGEQSGVI